MDKTISQAHIDSSRDPAQTSLESISDLNGTDLNIHDGTIEGVMRELSTHSSVEVVVSYSSADDADLRALSSAVPELKQRAGSTSLFEAKNVRRSSICCSKPRSK